MHSDLIQSSQSLPKRKNDKFFYPAFLWLPKLSEKFQIKANLQKLFVNHWIQHILGKKQTPETNDPRSTPRLSIHPKVLAYLLRPTFSRQPILGGVKNLSKKGVCVETPDSLSTANVFLLEFKFPGKKEVHVPAKVVWSKGKISGLEFLDSVGIEGFLESIKK